MYARDPEWERKEADVPRGELRTLDVIATEALLRFSITRNISKRETRISHLSLDERISDEGGFHRTPLYVFLTKWLYVDSIRCIDLAAI